MRAGITRRLLVAAGLLALIGTACSLVGTQTADRELQHYADRELEGAPSTLPTSIPIPTLLLPSSIPGLPTVPGPTTIPAPTTSLDEEGRPIATDRAPQTTAFPVQVVVPEIPGPTTPATTTTIRTVPSKFSGDSDFCEAGSNFYRAANVLFAAPSGIAREEMARLVSDYLKYLDQTIQLTPFQMYDVMAPVRDVRDQLRDPLLRLTDPDGFRVLAADVFGARPDVVAAVDYLVQWCGSDPSPRKDPRG